MNPKLFLAIVVSLFIGFIGFIGLITTSYNLQSKEPSVQNFTIVVIPDTQFYSANYPEIFTQQTEWIVDNIDVLNIKIVVHLGDLVNTPDSIQQWDNANKSMSVLDGKVPYTVLPGNGDFKESDFNNYDTYFGYKRFENYPWYGGHFPSDSNRNSYALLTIGDLKFGFLNIQFDPDNSELGWANDVVSSNPDYRFFIATHNYVSQAGHSAMGNRIWEGFAKKRDNIFFITNGHKWTEAKYESAGVNGNTVYEILSNYQSEPNGGNGKLRYYVFIPSENRIEAYTYSTYTNSYSSGPNSQFSMYYDMGS